MENSHVRHSLLESSINLCEDYVVPFNREDYKFINILILRL